jgi:hypothetical protein
VSRPIAVTVVGACACAAVVAWSISTGTRGPGDQARALTPAERQTLDRTEDLLIGQCMRRLGFAYHTPADPPPSPQPDRAHPYVLDDVALARAYGYGLADRRRAERERAANPNLTYYRSLDAARQRAYSIALDGPEPPQRVLSVRLPAAIGGGEMVRNAQGCRTTADRQLYGDVQRWFGGIVLQDNLPAFIQPQVRQDPRYIAAQRNWAQCMLRHHLRYRSPDEIRQILDSLSAKKDTERHLATTEATCAEETGFGLVATRLDQHYGDGVRSRYKQVLTSLYRMQRTALSKARLIDRNS